MSFRKKKKNIINQFNCPWLVMNPGSCKSRKNVRVGTERGPAARARSRCVPCGHHCLCRRCSHFRRSGKPVWGCEMQSASQCPWQTRDDLGREARLGCAARWGEEGWRRWWQGIAAAHRGTLTPKRRRECHCLYLYNSGV